MYIASKLKKQNICEYLLYMWQIEDLIRAYHLDSELIKKNIINPYPVTEDEKVKLFEWYESLIDMMRMEDLHKSGHLQLNKNIISELSEFHVLLLKSGQDAGYNAKFYHILPNLTQLIQKSNVVCSEIEMCFNFQYGIMALRLKKAEISQDTMQVQTEISKFMILLNKNYQLYKTGELSFED